MDDIITLDDPHTVPTRFWHSLEDGRLQCDLCPRTCRLREGQRGLCFVRARAGGTQIQGVYDGPAGQWGRRRLPVSCAAASRSQR